MDRSSKTLRAALVFGLVFLIAGAASAGTRVGGGVHYLRTLGEIKDHPDVEENSFAFLGSVAFSGALLRAEANLEFIPDYIGSGEAMWQPQGYLLLGDFLYGGAGIGVGYLSDFGWQDPFYMLRAGVDFMLGGLDLDVFSTYRFQKVKDLKGLGSDDANAVTFGALIRFGR